MPATKRISGSVQVIRCMQRVPLRSVLYGDDYFVYATETSVHVEPWSLPGDDRAGL